MTIKMLLTAVITALSVFFIIVSTLAPLIAPARYEIAINGCEVSINAENPSSAPNITIEQPESAREAMKTSCIVTLAHAPIVAPKPWEALLKTLGVSSPP